MAYTDFDCGIQQRHRHTGEIVEGYFIEYWCPTLTGWIAEDELYGEKCECTAIHRKARIQHTMTEIIDILLPIEEYIKEQLEERLNYMFMHGLEAYAEKYQDG